MSHIDGNRTPPHWLVIRRVASGRIIYTLPYPRSLDVAWAPNADRLLINDHQESNLSFAIVIDPRINGYSKTSLGDLVAAQSPVHGLFRRYGHLYLTGERWVDEHNVLVHIVGFDPLAAGIPKSIERLVAVRL